MRSNSSYRLRELIFRYGKKWDELAVDKEHAIEYAHRYINEEPVRYQEGTLRHTMEYVIAHSAESINERFRLGEENEIDQMVADMLSRHSCKRDLVLYRGVYEEVFQDMIKNSANIPDCDLYEKGFLCTSLVKGCEYTYDTSLRILVPHGSHAVYLGNVNDEQENYEVVVQRGARLRILSKDRHYLNCLLVGTWEKRKSGYSSPNA